MKRLSKLHCVSERERAPSATSSQQEATTVQLNRSLHTSRRPEITPRNPKQRKELLHKRADSQVKQSKYKYEYDLQKRVSDMLLLLVHPKTCRAKVSECFPQHFVRSFSHFSGICSCDPFFIATADWDENLVAWNPFSFVWPSRWLLSVRGFALWTPFVKKGTPQGLSTPK